MDGTAIQGHDCVVILGSIADRYTHSRSGMPTEFYTSCSPNPFNPVTEIQFALPEVASVKLSVYNLLGQEVAVLVDRNLDAGYHSAQWDASDFASGIYMYRLQAGDFVDTRKMILIK